MIAVEPVRVNLGGTIRQVGLAAGGVVALVHSRGGTGRLVILDSEGRVLGDRELASPSQAHRRALRIAEDGDAWVNEGRSLHRVGRDGRVVRAVDVPADAGEQLGGFLLLPDGFVAALYQPVRPPGARVTRLDRDGGVVWSAALPVDPVEFPGVVEMGAETGWKPGPMGAWVPADWQPVFDEPLLLAGDRLLASYLEVRSGLGVSYGLDPRTGAFLWATDPRPDGTLAVAGPGAFFVGAQGYGAFDLSVYDRDGRATAHWPTHGHVVVTPSGEVRVVEMENVLPSRMHFAVLGADGAVRRGPHLDGYYTAYPVVTRDREMAFWRHGRLRVVGPDLAERMLWVDGSLADEAVMTRMLLTDDGTLVFGLGGELIFARTDLGPLADSPWPCGGGNARGNPVWAWGR